jgi:rhodanese-related sulfurtransferase
VAFLHPSAIPSIDIHEADRRLRDAATAPGPLPLVVDVRNPDEFAGVRLPDAVLMPLPAFGVRYRELPADRPLLVLCRTGSRSLTATAHLLRNGFRDVVNVSGGIDAWERAGLPVRRGPVEPGEGELHPR